MLILPDSGWRPKKLPFHYPMGDMDWICNFQLWCALAQIFEKWMNKWGFIPLCLPVKFYFNIFLKKILVSKFDAENILDIVFCKRIVVMLPFHKACVLRDVLTTTIRPGLGQSHEQGIPVGFPVWVTGAPGICVAFHCLHSSINKNLD